MHLLAIKVEADQDETDDADEPQGDPNPDPDVAIITVLISAHIIFTSGLRKARCPGMMMRSSWSLAWGCDTQGLDP